MMTLLNNPSMLLKPYDIEEPEIVPRKKWKAKEPKETEETKDFPLPYLVLMHTNTPACKNKRECRKVVRELQKKHMDEGAPDILHNYLISLDGTVYEGRSPNMVGMTYTEELKKANKQSINVACIDEGNDQHPGDNLYSAATKLTAKLIRDKVLKEDVDIVWFERGKKKKKKLPLYKRMEQFRLNNSLGGNTSTKFTKKVSTRKRNKKIKGDSKPVQADFNDTVKREKVKGPYILEPHHFAALIKTSDEFASRGEEYEAFF